MNNLLQHSYKMVCCRLVSAKCLIVMISIFILFYYFFSLIIVVSFQTSSPFIDSAINELLRQRAPLVHDCLFQLFHSFKQSSQYTLCCRDTPHCIIYQVQAWTVCWPHHRLDKGESSLSAGTWWCLAVWDGAPSCHRSTLFEFTSVVRAFVVNISRLFNCFHRILCHKLSVAHGVTGMTWEVTYGLYSGISSGPIARSWV